jgi:hypothetical protein
MDSGLGRRRNSVGLPDLLGDAVFLHDLPDGLADDGGACGVGMDAIAT